MILIHWVHFPVRVWCVTAVTAEQKWQLCSWTPYSVPSSERGETGNLEPHFPFTTGPQHHGGCSIPVRRGCEEETKHHKSTSHGMRGKAKPCCEVILKKNNNKSTFLLQTTDILLVALLHLDWHVLMATQTAHCSTCCMCCVKKNSVESIELTQASSSGPGSFAITGKSFLS